MPILNRHLDRHYQIFSICFILLLFLFSSQALAQTSLTQPPPTQYPLVFTHGFNASPSSRWGFNPELISTLREQGHTVFVTTVSPFNGVAVRAIQLKTQIQNILKTTEKAKVNIIAHSMGGLDARYLISKLDFEHHIASLTTISTPHHGTLIADFLLSSTQVAPDLFNNFSKAIGEQYTSQSLANDSNLRDALIDLSEKHAANFNHTIQDSAKVYYQSWAGISNVGGIPGPRDHTGCSIDNLSTLTDTNKRDHMDLLLTPIASVVAHGIKLLPNDGVVTVQSAKWGRFRGCILADHLDQLGQVNDKNPNKHTGFDYIKFYKTLVSELSDLGF